MGNPTASVSRAPWSMASPVAQPSTSVKPPISSLEPISVVHVTAEAHDLVLSQPFSPVFSVVRECN